VAFSVLQEATWDGKIRLGNRGQKPSTVEFWEKRMERIGDLGRENADCLGGVERPEN